MPVLVTVLEQVPSRQNPEVQNQAAALLFETAGSDAGRVSYEVLLVQDLLRPSARCSHAQPLWPACLWTLRLSHVPLGVYVAVAMQEELVLMDCIPSLTTALQSGSYIKQARVCAILAMNSEKLPVKLNRCKAQGGMLKSCAMLPRYPAQASQR